MKKLGFWIQYKYTNSSPIHQTLSLPVGLHVCPDFSFALPILILKEEQVGDFENLLVSELSVEVDIGDNRLSLRERVDDVNGSENVRKVFQNQQKPPVFSPVELFFFFSLRFQVGFSFINKLRKRADDNILVSCRLCEFLPVTLRYGLTALLGLELDAQRAIRSRWNKQDDIRHSCGHSLALHNGGLTRVARSSVWDGKKKVSYLRVLQPKPHDATLLQS